MRSVGLVVAVFALVAGVATPGILIASREAHADIGSGIESRAGDFVVTGEADATSTKLRFDDGRDAWVRQVRGVEIETLATHNELDRMEVSMAGLIWANESLTDRQSALGTHFDILLAFLVGGFTVMGIGGWALAYRHAKLRDDYRNLRRDVESLNRAVTPPTSQGQGPMRTPGDNRPPPTRVPSGGTPVYTGGPNLFLIGEEQKA
jgi:hypothetical protein